MNALSTITGKILFLTIGFFILALACVLVISDRQLKKIIDSTQTSIYEEKIEIIWSELNRTEERLQQTGLIEAYSDDFKMTVINKLKETYYKKSDSAVYPLIADREMNIIVYPEFSVDYDFPIDNSLLLNAEFKNEKIRSYEDRKNWYIYREFKPWDWIILYAVPLAEKYKYVNSFRIFLISIIIIFSVFLSLFLFFFMVNFIKPVIMLTRVSQKISAGDLTQVFNSRRKDEIGILSRSFFQMQNSIKQKIEDLNKEIEEREKVEKKLSAASDYINNIMDSMPSIIIGVDKTGSITQWNRKAEILTEVNSEQAKGNKLENLIPYLSKDMARISKAINSGQAQVGLKHVRKVNNKNIYEDITIFPLTSKGDQGAVIRIDDVTEKKVLEEQLAQSYKMDAIGQLAGGIAHDFNNMLAGISGAAQLLQQSKMVENENSKKYIEMILEASQRASELTFKLLAFGRKSHYSTSTIDLNNVIQETISLLERTIDKKVKITAEYNASCDTIIGNFSAIQNALMNMAINSSHAMTEGGALSIITRNIQLDKNYCNLSPFEIQPGEYIDLEIRDNGKGIPSDHLGKIFEPFFTTKEQGKGTGLGLASVYGTVRNHKGAISVNSALGVGTVFHVLFPCTVQKRIIKAKITSNWKGEGTILFIDDEAIIRLTAKPILEKMGFQVLLAEDGDEGIKIYKKNKNIISLVITDMIMPKKSGSDVFRTINEYDKACPIIISSGFTRDENLNQLKKEGLAGFLQKPFSRLELEKMLFNILGTKDKI